jgi:hypothetical protein
LPFTVVSGFIPGTADVVSIARISVVIGVFIFLVQRRCHCCQRF